MHYKEIPDNLELDKFIEWALNNNDEAKQIAENGTEFFNTYLSADKIRNVWYTILKDYYRLYDITIEKR